MRVHRFIAIGLLAAAAACNRDESGTAKVDPTQLTSSGEVALADGGSMSFNITSERYKQWDEARRAFPKSLITRFGQVLQPRAPSERSINSAVALLEGNAQARQAIERAGLSVRGFVEITVALEQQMMLASKGEPRVETAPPPSTYPMTMDSGYYASPVPQQPYPYTPVPVTPPTPVTPYPTRDTVRPDTLLPAPMPAPAPAPRPDTLIPRRDTVPAPVPVRRDTMPVRRDTIVAPRPPARDTVRDTLPSIPPDTIRRA